MCHLNCDQIIKIEIVRAYLPKKKTKKIRVEEEEEEKKTRVRQYNKINYVQFTLHICVKEPFEIFVS